MERELTIILILLCFVSLVLGLRHEKQIVVSSYSKDSISDIKLLNLSGRGVPRLNSEMSEGNNPSYFTRGRGKILYFVNEVGSFKGLNGGGICAARLTRKGIEPLPGTAVNQAGGGPCFITLSGDGQFLLTANYGSGSVSVVKLRPDGMPGEVTDTLFFTRAGIPESHPHMILYNPSKDIYYVTDLGLDRIYIFRLDKVKGKLNPAETPFAEVEKGTGPRHMTMNRSRSVLYVADELNSTISVFDISGIAPVLIQTISALPADYKGESASADIALSGAGKYLYITNRGNNTIGVFRVNKGGRLDPAGHVSCGGDWPRNMAVDKRGKHMIICNQRSGDLAFFKINRRTGIPQKEDYSYKLDSPSCVKFIE